jgi:ABC-type Zn uptake system ZnuABC Zn-binding protein ZnuA
MEYHIIKHSIREIVKIEHQEDDVEDHHTFLCINNMIHF